MFVLSLTKTKSSFEEENTQTQYSVDLIYIFMTISFQ